MITVILIKIHVPRVERDGLRLRLKYMVSCTALRCRTDSSIHFPIHIIRVYLRRVHNCCIIMYNWSKPEQAPYTQCSCARILYYIHVHVLWYIGHAKLYTQQCSMDISVKHTCTIAHSHTWECHSNLGNCKFTLALLVL